MEIKKEPSKNNCININPNNANKLNKNVYSNENTQYNLFNNSCRNPYNNFFFLNKKKIPKRTYNDMLNSAKKMKITIKENEAKYLGKIFNQLKLKLDTQNNFIIKAVYPNKIPEKEKTENEDEEMDSSKQPYTIDYSAIDLNDIILKLYQNNNISDELKQFIFKKIINNAIQVEKTFHNYFNINNVPSKK